MLKFSPAGPIKAALIFFPRSSFILSSTSMAKPPQYSDASRISGVSPSSIYTYTGFSALPYTSTASYPENFNIGPKSPPQFASPHPPFFGDLQTTLNLWPNSGVPVRSPGMKPRTLSGPSGSAPAGIRSNNKRAPRPYPPRCERYTSSDIVSSSISFVVKLTFKILPLNATSDMVDPSILSEVSGKRIVRPPLPHRVSRLASNLITLLASNLMTLSK